jgi:glycogen(starch) synthase
VRAAGLIAASGAARRRLIGLVVQPARVEVALQSADVAAFRAAAAARAPSDPAAPVRLLAVGRLVADKNLARLLVALRRTGLSSGEVELEVCGDGPERGALQASARRLGVSVRFRGWVPAGELPAVYADADALVLVSTYEPFGVVVREAVAAGLPLVCSCAAGAAGDLAVDGRNALLVEPTDTDEIAAALRRLVTDSALRSAMAAESRALDVRHGPDADVQAWERAVLAAV